MTKQEQQEINTLVENLPCEYMTEGFKKCFKKIYGQLLALHLKLTEHKLEMFIGRDEGTNFCSFRIRTLVGDIFDLKHPLFVEYAYNIATSINHGIWSYQPVMTSGYKTWKTIQPAIFIVNYGTNTNPNESSVIDLEFSNLCEDLEPGSELGDWLIKATNMATCR